MAVFFADGSLDNVPSFQNYFVGRGTVGGVTLSERRNFFIFELPELLEGETVVEATFSLYLPTHVSIPANFTDGVEIFLVTSSVFPADAIIDPEAAMVPPEEIFATFGEDTFYGDFPVFHEDPPTGDFPLETLIPLSPEAVEDIGAASGGLFVITGRMATYDPEPAALDEAMYTLSDLIVEGIPTGLPMPFLSITTTTLLLGDVNLDGAVNLLDVGPFVERVASGTYQAEADCNGDGSVNLLDVDAFIAILGA